MNDRERLLQAFENVADTFGGASRTLLLAIVKEEKRLKKWEESQKAKEIQRRYEEARKEFKATGKWPDGYGDNDDDIPF